MASEKPPEKELKKWSSKYRNPLSNVKWRNVFTRGHPETQQNFPRVKGKPGTELFKRVPIMYALIVPDLQEPSIICFLHVPAQDNLEEA